MPIKKDLSALPTPPRNEGGMLPVTKPVVIQALGARWFEKYSKDQDLDLPKAIPERRFRASWASARCDRTLYYQMFDVPKTEPATLADYWRFGLGHMVHEYLQTEFALLFPDKKIWVEVPTDLRPIGLDGSATVDIVIEPGTADERRIVVEVKTINGFGFKKSATAFKGPPTGPRWGAIVQGALSAAALDADLIIVYISLECLSPSMALSYGDGTTLGQFAAEWHIDAASAADIAAAEVARNNRVIDLADADIIPPRTIHDPELPAGATVVDPARKTWHVRNGDTLLGTGTTWMCDYCDYRTQCIKDGEGGAPTTEEF